MKKILSFISIVSPFIVFAQTSATTNTLGTTGITAIQSTTSTGYKLSVGGAVKQFGTGLDLVGSPTLFLHNTTASTGRQYGINAGDNGLFQVFDVTSSNAVRFTINGTGNIGIGTTIANSKLEIDNSTAGTSGLRFTRLTSASAVSVGNGKVLTVDANGNVILVNDSTANSLSWLLGGSTVSAIKSIGTVNSFDLPFITNNVERLRISNAGNIGIGIATPLAQLHTTGSLRFDRFKNNTALDSVLTTDANGNVVFRKIVIVSDSTKWGLTGNTVRAIKNFGTIDNFDLPFITNNAERLRISNTGNIGIGITAPLAQLHTTGSLRFDRFKNNAALDSILTTDVNGNVVFKKMIIVSDSTKWTLTGNTVKAIKAFGTIDNFDLPFITNNVERLRISNTGNIGIGIIAPLAQLHTSGSLRFERFKNNAALDSVLSTDANGNVVFKKIVTPSDSTKWGLGGNTVRTIKTFGTIDNFDLPITTNNVERVRINNAGNVGIGISAPLAQLHTTGSLRFDRFKNNAALDSVLSTDANGNVVFKKIVTLSDSTKWGFGGNTVRAIKNIGTVDNFDLPFITSNTEKMRITSGGNVGIGVLTPQSKLDVSGSIRATGLIIPTGAATGKVLMSDASGNATWQALSGTSAGTAGWGLNGNSVGSLKTFGTVDNFDLPFIINNTERLRLTTSGNLLIGSTSDNGNRLQVNGSFSLLNPYGWKLWSGTDGYGGRVSLSSNGYMSFASQENQYTFLGVTPGFEKYSTIVIHNNDSAVHRYAGVINGFNKSSYKLETTQRQDLLITTSTYNSNSGNVTGDIIIEPGTWVAPWTGETSYTTQIDPVASIKLITGTNGNLNFKTARNTPVDTMLYKPLVIDSSGNITKSKWPFSTGSSGNSNWTTSGNNIYNANSGLVIIGNPPSTTPTDANLKLAVVGNISAQKLKITQTGWADYVFDSTYKLRPLQEVEKFIQKNQHLPEIPSAADVNKNGVDVGDNQIALLKKVEELTLYIISLDKKVAALEKENQRINSKASKEKVIKKKTPIK